MTLLTCSILNFKFICLDYELVKWQITIIDQWSFFIEVFRTRLRAFCVSIVAPCIFKTENESYCVGIWILTLKLLIITLVTLKEGNMFIYNLLFMFTWFSFKINCQYNFLPESMVHTRSDSHEERNKRIKLIIHEF